MSYSAGQQIEVYGGNNGRDRDGNRFWYHSEDAAAYRNWLSVLSHSDSEPYSTH